MSTAKEVIDILDKIVDSTRQKTPQEAPQEAQSEPILNDFLSSAKNPVSLLINHCTWCKEPMRLGRLRCPNCRHSYPDGENIA